MKQAICVSICLGASLMCGCASNSISLEIEGEETEVTVSQVPTPAREAIEALAGGIPVRSWEREQRGKTVMYEGEWTVPAGEAEATVTAEGAVVETEDDVPPQAIPVVIRRLVETQAPGADRSYAVRKLYLYEVEFEHDGETVELLIAPDGTILTEEREPTEDK